MTILLLLLLLVLGGPPPVSVQVAPKFALQRSDVRVRARIEPHPDNRLLRVIIDGPQYMAQDEELEGEHAPKFRERWFKQVPPGQYLAVAVLVRSGGKEYLAKDAFCITGPENDCAK